MKILKIGGRNLASLAGDFEVDFEQEPLASAGLFAISGPTGAGKTTLLDALCLALYDATPRMLRGGSALPDVGATTVAAQDPRTLLRRGAAEGHAEVDFVGNDKLRYRARWSVRRSYKKASGALQPTTMTLHRLPELTALGGTKTEVAAEIVKCIGLTFEQFTRAVLLAQNEFSAFLKTDENDRGELLETLTGSAIYSVISRRAHERYKAEQQALQQLKTRLADHIALSAEARCGLDADCAAAQAALALADARKAALEQQLRWHQEAARLRASEAQAEQALAHATQASQEAAPRRTRLALRETAEAARALHGEGKRLQQEITAIEGALHEAQARLQQTRLQQQESGVQVAGALAALEAAETAQQDAAPQLNLAKALDAGIATLAPAHAAARSHLDGARRERAQAQAAVQTGDAEQARTLREQDSATQWLAAHAGWETLARQWPRWDSLLTQARASAQELHRIDAESSSAQLAQRSAAAAEQRSAGALAEMDQHLAALDAARQHASASLAAFDTDQLRADRERLELRRDAMAASEARWSALADTHARLAHVTEQAAALAAAGSAAASALSEAAADAPSLAAALKQSERSLQAAELACAQSVQELRATLADGEPCPVCGGAEHPYQHQQPALHDMLASLRIEVQRCRTLDQENASLQAAQRALLARHDEQQASVARELAQRRAELERTQAAWAACPLAAEAPDQEERTAWFGELREAMRAALKGLDQQERGAREAARARDMAQQAYDRSAAGLAAARDQASAASAAQVKAAAALAALAERQRHVQAQLARLFDELAPVLAPGPERAAWQDDPEAFQALRAAEAAQWQAQSSQHAERALRLGELAAQLASAHTRATQASASEQAAAAQWEQLEADIGQRRQQRAALWQGRATDDIERGLAGAVAAARSTLAARQQASQEAAQAQVRVLEMQAQLAKRLSGARQQAAEAAGALAAWLENTPEIAALDDLSALLQLDRASLLAERADLQRVDEALARAITVLAERRQQSLVHQQSAPADDSSSDSLAQALAALEGERRQAQETATALSLQIAQDDARRRNSQAMMAQVEQQEQAELRWGRLNELVGSADGKKFRNYAQQFTLDVLLGYANSHLQHLARRYRLERISTAAGPSLGLLVRDQDMGGEIRSVNSLSGGESFLVSLALALGLASLSSNRVRVESLFIDEGFGSLDSETLRVAMDALDGLQSMGRKVGVISHVQEMTERIATRVLVQPAGGGSSSVTVQ